MWRRSRILQWNNEQRVLSRTILDVTPHSPKNCDLLDQGSKVDKFTKNGDEIPLFGVKVGPSSDFESKLKSARCLHRTTYADSVQDCCCEKRSSYIAAAITPMNAAPKELSKEWDTSIFSKARKPRRATKTWRCDMVGIVGPIRGVKRERGSNGYIHSQVWTLVRPVPRRHRNSNHTGETNKCWAWGVKMRNQQVNWNTGDRGSKTAVEEKWS